MKISHLVLPLLLIVGFSGCTLQKQKMTMGVWVSCTHMQIDGCEYEN